MFLVGYFSMRCRFALFNVRSMLICVVQCQVKQKPPGNLERSWFLQELKAEEERAALAAVAAALERETLEQAKLKEDQAMGPSQPGAVAESRSKEEDNQQVAASALHELNNET